jgi:hypothetical protein
MIAQPLLRRSLVTFLALHILAGYPLYLLSVPLNWQLEPARVDAFILTLSICFGFLALIVAVISNHPWVARSLANHKNGLSFLFCLFALGNFFLTSVQLLPTILLNVFSAYPRIVHILWIFSAAGPWGTIPLNTLGWALFIFTLYACYQKPLPLRLKMVKLFLLVGATVVIFPWLRVFATWAAYQSDQPHVVQYSEPIYPLKSAPRRVVLLTFDAWRYRSTSFFENRRLSQTPHLDSLGATSHVFTECRSAGDMTGISLSSLMTGIHPPQMYSIPSNGMYSIRDESIPNIASYLKRAGYSTEYDTIWFSPILAGMSPAFDKGLPRAALLAQGAFNVNFNGVNFLEGRAMGAWLRNRITHLLAAADQGTDPPTLNEMILNDYLERSRGDRAQRFTWLHFAAPHTPYYAIRPGERKEALRNTSAYMLDEKQLLAQGDLQGLETGYEQYVSVADSYIGEIVKHLKDSGMWEDTLFIVTSDHGEMHRSQEYFSHGFGVPFPDINRVPLVIHLPGQKIGTRDSRVASLIDILPTILDVTCGQVPDYLPGVSLARASKDKKRVVFTWTANWNRVVPINVPPVCSSISAFDGRFELIKYFNQARSPELFDRYSGYDNTPNEVEHYPEVHSRLEQAIELQCPPVWKK